MASGSVSEGAPCKRNGDGLGGLSGNAATPEQKGLGDRQKVAKQERNHTPQPKEGKS